MVGCIVVVLFFYNDDFGRPTAAAASAGWSGLRRKLVLYFNRGRSTYNCGSSSCTLPYYPALEKDKYN
jgi:peroxiredoxin